MPRQTLKGIAEKLAGKGMSIRRISRDDPWGGYRSGLLVTHSVDGTEEHFASLDAVNFYRIENTNAPNFCWKP
jgi:hypothetical protein